MRAVIKFFKKTSASLVSVFVFSSCLSTLLYQETFKSSGLYDRRFFSGNKIDRVVYDRKSNKLIVYFLYEDRSKETGKAKASLSMQSSGLIWYEKTEHFPEKEDHLLLSRSENSKYQIQITDSMDKILGAYEIDPRLFVRTGEELIRIQKDPEIYLILPFRPKCSIRQLEGLFEQKFSDEKIYFRKDSGGILYFVFDKVHQDYKEISSYECDGRTGKWSVKSENNKYSGKTFQDLLSVKLAGTDRAGGVLQTQSKKIRLLFSEKDFNYGTALLRGSLYGILFLPAAAADIVFIPFQVIGIYFISRNIYRP